MDRHSQDGLTLFTFPGLALLPGVVHAVTARQGGISPPPFDALNLGGGRDLPANIEANRRRLAEALGLSALAWAHQVHGTRVAEVRDPGRDLGEADGLATDRPGVGLLIKQADCQAVILAAPARGVVANLHVGWRGNAADMPGAGVRFLRERYGAAPHELHAAVSPGLGPCCGQLVNYRRELPRDLWRFRAEGDLFDLPAVTHWQLERAGLDPERIELSGLCTRCDGRFFSYRRDGLTGRHGTVVALEAS